MSAMDTDKPSSSDVPAQSSSTAPPINMVILGMAGSGKTTTVQRLAAWLQQNQSRPYLVNLDPAVLNVPYPVNIDIRDTVNYKEVMKQFELGPNGAILTSLNLFATRIDQVVRLIEQRKTDFKYVLYDTPGQIEAVTWSASGMIIIETLASLYPTVILYIVDTSKCLNPITFMSCMLYACSISYKMKLPFIVVFNKTDILSADFAIDWMKDFQSFSEALDEYEAYSADLAHSLSLALDEYYSVLKYVCVSSRTGEGMDRLFQLVLEARDEYEREYRPHYEWMKKQKEEAEIAARAKQLEQLKIDIQEEPMKSEESKT